MTVHVLSCGHCLLSLPDWPVTTRLCVRCDKWRPVIREMEA